MNKTQQEQVTQPWLHESVKTEKCMCGDYVTWTWNYKAKQWETLHECRWQHPIGNGKGKKK